MDQMFLRMRQPLLRKQHLDWIKNSSFKLYVFIEFWMRIRFNISNRQIKWLFQRDLKSHIMWVLKFLYLLNFLYLRLGEGIREVIWNAPKSIWKVILSCDGICNFILKCPKIEEFHFWFLFYFKTDHVFLLMPHFPLSES